MAKKSFCTIALEFCRSVDPKYKCSKIPPPSNSKDRYARRDIQEIQPQLPLLCRHISSVLTVSRSLLVGSQQLCHIFLINALWKFEISQNTPWLVWLSGSSTSLQNKGWLVQFPVRAHAWVAGLVPGGGHVKGNHMLMFLSLSCPSL